MKAPQKPSMMTEARLKMGSGLVLEANKTQMKIERGISLSDFVDLSMLKEAQKEPGDKGQ